jgi:hypothetical protein
VQVMRQIQSPAPNPFRSRGPYRSMVSNDWVPRNYVQRIGAFMIGAICLMGGVAVIASTVFFKAELIAELHSPSAAVLFGVVLVSLALMTGAIVTWLSIRLLKGAFRPSTKHSKR